VSTDGALYLEIGPPDRDVGALVMINPKVFAEQAALDRHAEILATGHHDLVDEIDNHPADERAGRGEVDVSGDRSRFRGVRGGCKEEKHRGKA
jgi:hypothetical protein